jgi:hypothetical protein
MCVIYCPIKKKLLPEILGLCAASALGCVLLAWLCAVAFADQLILDLITRLMLSKNCLIAEVYFYSAKLSWGWPFAFAHLLLITLLYV